MSFSTSNYFIPPVVEQPFIPEHSGNYTYEVGVRYWRPTSWNKKNPICPDKLMKSFTTYYEYTKEDGTKSYGQNNTWVEYEGQHTRLVEHWNRFSNSPWKYSESPFVSEELIS